ncbi:helix-turn-helix domain-containing protein [Ruminiclostridium cellobioparum]|uniref:Helix-turn-helix protein n=1 Tax=Ruminiclostridium cellobioparum subsp. termitidis CT1112 TaxID=1195236 RepID=S0FL76_RUMCE|nr:helix-turn-helix transcriptional regulator [Ruminiclostridium cellobioparum]EMS72960.1 helix-turn-helix protein [Ruminiclostridium cellobioparum subsp. termitidis CT1112]
MTGKYSDRYKKIGQKIKYYRRRKGLTQQELADKISISLSYLTKIEAQNCDKPFSLEVLFEVSDALNIPVTCLLEDI